MSWNKPMQNIFYRNTLLIFFVMLSLSGCENRNESSHPGVKEVLIPEYGDTFIESSIGDASTLLPVLASDSASSEINGLIYNGLVRYDKNLQIEGELAESWEISEDNLTITFHLRKGVTWHDGAPFTSADVKFNYQLYIDPKTPTAYAESFKQVTGIETPDPYTFIVHYDKPYAPALMSWAMSIHPRHLLEGKEITKSPLARQPIGTGPYRFSEWVGGEKIVLESNPDYFEGQPYLKRVVYRIIPDISTQFLELQTGSLDYMGLSPLQFDRQTDTPAFRRLYNKYRYLNFGYTYLGYNLRHPIFQDKRVRQALSYAINKQELIDGVLLGYGKVATGPYKPDTWVYNNDVPKYKYNPEKARQLLAEAGWLDHDGDGDGPGNDSGGIEAWLRLGEATGLSRATLQSQTMVLPGVRFAVDAYVNFARRASWQEAACSSLTELFAPTIHQRRLDTWPQLYPWIEPQGYHYFRKRLSEARRDVEHGLQVTLEHFRSRVQQEYALSILQFKLDLLWSMLDAMWLAYIADRPPYCDIDTDSGTDPDTSPATA